MAESEAHALATESSESAFPSTGVSVPFLRQFFADYCIPHPSCKELTTTDINELFVKPKTKDSQQSYASLFRDIPNAFGPATHFVSHAWKYTFADLISAIGIFYDGLPQEVQNSNTVFFWIDLFVIDQNNSVTRPHSWWSTTFVEAIRKFGKVLLVFQPFLDPLPLKRAWCLW